MQDAAYTSSGSLHAGGNEGCGGRRKCEREAEERPATAGNEGIRGRGSQGGVVGTGTHLPQSAVVVATLLRRAMQRWVSACTLQRSPHVQARHLSTS